MYADDTNIIPSIDHHSSLKEIANLLTTPVLRLDIRKVPGTTTSQKQGKRNCLNLWITFCRFFPETFKMKL
jgi:hypothetical protein